MNMNYCIFLRSDHDCTALYSSIQSYNSTDYLLITGTRPGPDGGGSASDQSGWGGRSGEFPIMSL